jgi:hypothetical protein
MRVHIWPTACSVCGGEGMTTSAGNDAQWRGATMVHSDPEICRMNVERERREMQERIDELSAA